MNGSSVNIETIGFNISESLGQKPISFTVSIAKSC